LWIGVWSCYEFTATPRSLISAGWAFLHHGCHGASTDRRFPFFQNPTAVRAPLLGAFFSVALSGASPSSRRSYWCAISGFSFVFPPPPPSRCDPFAGVANRVRRRAASRLAPHKNRRQATSLIILCIARLRSHAACALSRIRAAFAPDVRTSPPGKRLQFHHTGFCVCRRIFFLMGGDSMSDGDLQARSLFGRLLPPTSGRRREPALGPTVPQKSRSLDLFQPQAPRLPSTKITWRPEFYRTPT